MFFTDKRKCTVEDLKPSIIEEDCAIKYSIFKDIWEKGHYITDGLKFGCDYLVYPGIYVSLSLLHFG